MADDGMRRGNTRGLNPVSCGMIPQVSRSPTLRTLTVVGCEMKESFSFAETARGPPHPPPLPYPCLTTNIIITSCSRGRYSRNQSG